ncbi:MAG: TIGR03560 family F420-dependent LLM class oxidoreductase [Acidimicrobiia bacterium]|nr:TIGR03560 family F420-dependent LLM class oxidoreductase [Acidimicrobiia bacterium]
MIRLPADALVVLAGPSGSGKSTWAAEWFRSSQVVSSDDLRGVVGHHEHDLRASADAFAVLDLVVERRLDRGLVTVVDTLGMDGEQHSVWLAQADRYGRPAHLVRFDVDDKTCRKQNRSRPSPVPSKVLTAQLEKWAQVKEDLGVGYVAVHDAGPVSVMPAPLLATGPDRRPTLAFGLQVAAFDWPGDNDGLAEILADVAVDAERAGFTSLWLMDHLVQIPQVGRPWEPMLESYTTLGYLAARTRTIGLGALVTCITLRNIAHLAKIVATLDVLSGGRARCGLGLGWFAREHQLYDVDFPPVAERYELLADALELLPLMWGPGSPAFEGRRVSTPEATCYPRPLQQRIPMLVGGSGEQRTLRLTAEYADACNLFGEPDVIARKVEVLHRHCEELGRDPREIEITQLSPILCAPDRTHLAARLDELGGTEAPELTAERLLAGTADEHVDRFGRLASAGVDTVIVSLADVGRPGAVEAMGPVIEAFSP